MRDVKLKARVVNRREMAARVIDPIAWEMDSQERKERAYKRLDRVLEIYRGGLKVEGTR